MRFTEVARDWRRPWGPWETTGFTAIVILAVIGVHMAVAESVARTKLMSEFPSNAGDLVARVELLGIGHSIAIWASAAVSLGLTGLWVSLRRELMAWEYLALRPASLGTLLAWMVLTAALLGGEAALWYSMHDAETPRLFADEHRAAASLPLAWTAAALWTALVLAAPLWEELVFRGFMFRGIEASRLGSGGAIVVTALVWSAAHFGQCDLIGLALTFITGLLLGAARAASGSVYVTIAMHSLWNLGVILLAVMRLAQS